MKCLLIETYDKRKFFTYQKNFGPLIEFSKSFKANILLVNMIKGELLDLNELAPAICSPSTKNQKVEYEVLANMLTSNKNSRKNLLSQSEKIQKFITTTYKQGEIVDLQKIKKKFKNFTLTDAALCNHAKKSREKLALEGYKFEKVGAGKYRMI